MLREKIRYVFNEHSLETSKKVKHRKIIVRNLKTNETRVLILPAAYKE